MSHEATIFPIGTDFLIEVESIKDKRDRSAITDPTGTAQMKTPAGGAVGGSVVLTYNAADAKLRGIVPKATMDLLTEGSEYRCHIVISSAAVSAGKTHVLTGPARYLTGVG